MNLTRRQLATVLAPAMALAGNAAAQPAPPVDEELRAARERIRIDGETLARHDLPMSAAPAFQFKA